MDYLQPGTVIEADRIESMMDAMAAAVAEEFRTRASELCVVGLQKHGVPLAKRIAEKLERLLGTPVKQGVLDITMYRDDIGIRGTLPVIRETNIPFDMNGSVLILVDDVMEAGRTIRAALDAITDFGRPAVTRLAVLVDRGKHEFPIAADYVGMKCSSPAECHVRVRWPETDGEFCVRIEEKKKS